MNKHARTETEATHTAPRQYVRALIVDSSIEHQQSARDFLVQLGCQVDVAADAQLAVALSQIVRYHMIFIDGPILAGLLDTSPLRDLEVDGRCISIVSMLDKAASGTPHRHTVMGANDVIHKPLTRKAFEGAMDTWLKRGAVDVEHRV